LKKTNPSLAEGETPEEIKQVEVEAKLAQDRKNESVCKKCGRLKEIDACTALDLSTMVELVGGELAELYLHCYLEPTSHMHATGSGTSARASALFL
jgi:hypothetical protein